MTEKEYLEFKNLISMGDELNFYYKNDEYWISHIQDKSFLSRTKDSYTILKSFVDTKSFLNMQQ